jgi:hypothetical protein
MATAAPKPDPAPAAAPAEHDPYRAQTLAVDAAGVALMTLGFIGVHHDWNNSGYGSLVVAGVVTSAFGAPIIHAAHGRWDRAGGSYLARSLGATMGTFAGIAAACQDGLAAVGECGMGRIMLGAAGGLALAGVVDAVFFHDDERSSRWTPMVAPTTGGSQFGLATAF